MISLNQLEWKSIYIIHSEDQKKKKRQMNKVLENFSINIKYRVFLLYVSVSLSLHIDRWIYRDIQIDIDIYSIAIQLDRQIHGISEGCEKEKLAKIIFEEIMVEKNPKFMKDHTPKISTYYTSNKLRDPHVDIVKLRELRDRSQVYR